MSVECKLEHPGQAGAMKDLIFHQHHDLSREVFILKSDRLFIVETALGMTNERTIKLSSIAKVEHVSRYFARFYVPYLILAAASAVGGWLLFGRSVIYTFAALSLALAVPGFLLVMWDRYEPIETTQFKGRSGGVLFELYRHKTAILAHDEFVAELRRRIENTCGEAQKMA